jgi:hypothetical protein
LSSRRGNLHRIVRVALGPAASSPGCPLVDPMSACRRPVRANFCVKPVTDVYSASYPGNLRGPTSRHILHLIATSPISGRLPQANRGQASDCYAASKRVTASPSHQTARIRKMSYAATSIIYVGNSFALTWLSCTRRTTTIETTMHGDEPIPSVDTGITLVN